MSGPRSLPLVGKSGVCWTFNLFSRCQQSVCDSFESSYQCYFCSFSIIYRFLQILLIYRYFPVDSKRVALFDTEMSFLSYLKKEWRFTRVATCLNVQPVLWTIIIKGRSTALRKHLFSNILKILNFVRSSLEMGLKKFGFWRNFFDFHVVLYITLMIVSKNVYNI